MATDPSPWRALAELALAIASEQLGTAALKAALSSTSPLFLVLSALTSSRAPLSLLAPVTNRPDN